MDSTAHDPALLPPSSELHSPVGHHILLEFSACAAELLNDPDRLEVCLVESCREAGATVVQSTFHAFNPIGASGVVVIAESHVTIHTWPEHGYAALDIFTCGRPEIAERIEEELRLRFTPGRIHRRACLRQPMPPFDRP